MRKLLFILLFIFPILQSHHMDIHADKKDKNLLGALQDGRITTVEAYFDFAKRNKIPSPTVQETVNEFIDLYPTIEQINQYTRLFGQTTDPFVYIQVKEYGLSNHLPQSVDEFFTLMDYALPYRDLPNPAYREGLAQLIVNHMDLFFDLNPTIEQIIHLTKIWGNISDPSLFIALKQHALERRLPQNVNEFFTLMDYALPYGCYPNPAYKEALAQLISNHLNVFLDLNPTITQMNQLTKKWGHTTDPSLFIALKRHALEHRLPQNVNEFFTLTDYALPYEYNWPGERYTQQRLDLLKKHLDVFLALHPTPKEVNRLIREVPKLKSLLVLFRKPLTSTSFYQKVNELQKQAYTNLKTLCDQQRKRIIKGEKNKKKCAYLKELIDRQHAHTKNEIGHKMLAFMNNHELDLTQVPIVYTTLHSIENSFTQAIQQAEQQIEKAYKMYNYDGLQENEWSIPMKIARVGHVHHLDHLIEERNQGISSTSSSSTTCSICEEVSGGQVTISSCGHTTCTPCYQVYIRTKLNNDEFPIRCFSQDCKAILTEKEIEKAAVGEEDIAKWRKQTLLHLPKGIKCPRDQCDETLFIHEHEKHHDVLCGKCFQDICPRCAEFAHKGISCEEVPKLKRVLFSGELEYKELVEKRVIQECPKCKTPGIRQDGCLHITCPTCSTRWNYEGAYRIDDDKTLEIRKKPFAS